MSYMLVDPNNIAVFLRELGLKSFPPLATIISMAANPDLALHGKSLTFFLQNFSARYEKQYRPQDFSTKRFIPALFEGKACLRGPEEVYASTKSAIVHWLTNSRHRGVPKRQMCGPWLPSSGTQFTWRCFDKIAGR